MWSGGSVSRNDSGSRLLTLEYLEAAFYDEVAKSGLFKGDDLALIEESYRAIDAALARYGYEISYDWYVDTSAYGANAGTFMQIGTYVNTGSGYYAQDFPGAGNGQFAFWFGGQSFDNTICVDNVSLIVAGAFSDSISSQNTGNSAAMMIATASGRYASPASIALKSSTFCM